MMDNWPDNKTFGSSPMRVEIKFSDVRDILSDVMKRTTTRGEGVALVLAVYVAICEGFEPKMTREIAAQRAKEAVLSAHWDAGKDTMQ